MSSPGGAARILVVDDEEINRHIVVAQLEADGYQMSTAASGEEALGLIERGPPDLILLDVMMPGINGFAVAERLKAEQRTAHIPIIMLSALSDSDSRLSGLSHGAEEFLSKPVGRAELCTRVRNLLKLKKYQDDLAARAACSANQLQRVSRHLDELQAQLQQSERLAAIGQLASRVAHEINHPVGFVNANLGALKGYVKDMQRMLHAYEAAARCMPRDAALEAKLQQLRGELELDYLCGDAPVLIDESIAGLARICQTVQALRSFTHDAGCAERMPTDVHECLDSALDIAGNGIACRARVLREYGRVPEIICMPSQLNQAFLNLLVNAAQAMPEQQQGVICVRTFCVDSTVCVEIADDGPGMDAQQLSRLFDPSYAARWLGQGGGPGLALSREIVQRHGGCLEVDSAPGQGTTFRVVLPLALAQDGAPDSA